MSGKVCGYCDMYHDRGGVRKKIIQSDVVVIRYRDATVDCPGWGDGCPRPGGERGTNKRLEWIQDGWLWAREDGKCLPCVKEWNECGLFYGLETGQDPNDLAMPLYKPAVKLREIPMLMPV